MASSRSRRATSSLAAAIVVVLGASACTAGGDDDQAADELPLEVEGEVLDRRDPPGHEADEPEDADDTDDTDGTEAAEEPGGSDDPGDAGGTDVAGDDDRSGATAPAASPSPTPAPGGGTASPTPTPVSPTPAAPAPIEAAPRPVATPAPRVLAAGPARSTGPVLDSDGAAWTVTSSSTVERGADAPALTVATRPGDDTPRRQVTCAAALEAPSDRGLVARGTLTVSFRVVDADGAVQVLPRQRLELDATLEPGRRLDLPVPAGRSFDVADVRQVTCVADLAT